MSEEEFSLTLGHVLRASGVKEGFKPKKYLVRIDE